MKDKRSGEDTVLKGYIIRLYELDRSKFKRNFAPSITEIAHTKARKKLPVNIRLQNGESKHVFAESYNTLDDILRALFKQLDLGKDKLLYFYIRETIEKKSQVEERFISEYHLIGDVFSSWDIIQRANGESFISSKLYLALKYYPIQKEAIEDLLDFILYSFIYDVYFNKIALERVAAAQIWSLCFQIEYGDFEEKPGFIKSKLKGFHHPFFYKYFNDETFISRIEELYKEHKGKDRIKAIKELLCIGENWEHELNHYFKIKFRNSNNPTYREMQENLILGVNQSSLILYEETSREKIIDIKLEDIMNWGINNDIIVVCYGDKHEVTKLYFESTNPYEIADLLYAYANMKVGEDIVPIGQRYQELDQFLVDGKIRRANIFFFK